MAASLQPSLLTGKAVAILTACAYHCAACLQLNCLYVACSHCSEHAALGLEHYNCAYDMLHCAAGHAVCLVEPSGILEDRFCTTLPLRHVCLHANATVRGLLPGKGESSVRSIGELIAAAASAAALALVQGHLALVHALLCHLVEKCLPVRRLGNTLTNSLPRHIDTVESINLLQRIVLKVACGPCCTH